MVWMTLSLLQPCIRTSVNGAMKAWSFWRENLNFIWGIFISILWMELQSHFRALQGKERKCDCSPRLFFCACYMMMAWKLRSFRGVRHHSWNLPYIWFFQRNSRKYVRFMPSRKCKAIKSNKNRLVSKAVNEAILKLRNSVRPLARSMMPISWWEKIRSNLVFNSAQKLRRILKSGKKKALGQTGKRNCPLKRTNCIPQTSMLSQGVTTVQESFRRSKLWPSNLGCTLKHLHGRHPKHIFLPLILFWQMSTLAQGGFVYGIDIKIVTRSGWAMQKQTWHFDLPH